MCLYYSILLVLAIKKIAFNLCDSLTSVHCAEAKNISSFLQHVRELPNRIIQETDERDATFDVVTFSLKATRATFSFSATSSIPLPADIR